MKKVYVSYPLYVALGALFLIGCASTNPRSAASPVDYTRPEIQEIFSSSWTGRLEWENRGGMDRYEAEIEFEHNPSENNVIARIDLTLLEAHRMSVQNGQEGKKAQWFLSGDLLETGGGVASDGTGKGRSPRLSDRLGCRGNARLRPGVGEFHR